MQEISVASGRRQASARERLLELAEAAVLEKGFAATSIDELITGAGITKSGFFYHFKDKADLARALMERYIATNDALLAEIMARADALDEDPLHSCLIALKLLADLLSDLPGGHPGCLIASFCYQDRLFDREVRELMQAGNIRWRRLFSARFAAIAARYPPRLPVNPDDLGDMMNAVVDGGIIQAKVMRDPAILPRQVLLLRDFVRLVFQPVPAMSNGSAG